jgi:hypothetical protein
VVFDSFLGLSWGKGRREGWGKRRRGEEEGKVGGEDGREGWEEGGFRAEEERNARSVIEAEV